MNKNQARPTMSELTGFQLLAKKVTFKSFAPSATGQCREYYSVVGEIFQVTRKTVLTLHCNEVDTWHYGVKSVDKVFWIEDNDILEVLK